MRNMAARSGLAQWRVSFRLLSGGVFGIRVKTGHSDASCDCSRTHFTISPTTDRLTLPFNAS